MHRKGSIDVREAVEAKDVAEALAKVRTLPSEDERVLRMRFGASVRDAERLDQHGEGNAELQDELLLMEMGLLRAHRQHQKQKAQSAAPRPSRAKEKIVRALRKKH
jgi:hypothetical protein